MLNEPLCSKASEIKPIWKMYRSAKWASQRRINNWRIFLLPPWLIRYTKKKITEAWIRKEPQSENLVKCKILCNYFLYRQGASLIAQTKGSCLCQNFSTKNSLYTAWMKPGFMAMRKISVSIIAREHFRIPHATVATINTFVSSSAVIKKQNHN